MGRISSKKLKQISFLVFFVFLQNFNFAQDKFVTSLQINYDIYYNTEMPNIKKGVLYINEPLTSSLFIYGKRKDRTINTTSENTLQIKFSESERFNYFKSEVDSIYSKEKILRNEFIINEKAETLDWIVTSETKIIDKLLAKKATLKFRGRNYIAWFSEDYPLKFGPWKFNKLPGLILEIYDDTQRYRWVISSIRKSKKSIDLTKMLQSSKKVSIKDYVDMRYNQGLNLFNASRLPRGTSMNKRKIKRNGIELLFEWEEKQ
ncbi:GLPGLI family protein [Polaribacter sp. M15]